MGVQACVRTQQMPQEEPKAGLVGTQDWVKSGPPPPSPTSLIQVCRALQGTALSTHPNLPSSEMPRECPEPREHLET